jgi:hypothetical protein
MYSVNVSGVPCRLIAPWPNTEHFTGKPSQSEARASVLKFRALLTKDGAQRLELYRPSALMS